MLYDVTNVRSNISSIYCGWTGGHEGQSGWDVWAVQAQVTPPQWPPCKHSSSSSSAGWYGLLDRLVNPHKALKPQNKYLKHEHYKVTVIRTGCMSPRQQVVRKDRSWYPRNLHVSSVCDWLIKKKQKKTNTVLWPSFISLFELGLEVILT